MADGTAQQCGRVGSCHIHLNAFTVICKGIFHLGTVWTMIWGIGGFAWLGVIVWDQVEKLGEEKYCCVPKARHLKIMVYVLQSLGSYRSNSISILIYLNIAYVLKLVYKVYYHS